jgi:hypothetical protein
LIEYVDIDLPELLLNVQRHSVVILATLPGPQKRGTGAPSS